MELYPDISDPRRYTAWATVYEGLKIWEIASSKFNLEWRAPSYEEFVNNVVKKIEEFGKKSEISALSDFLDWWELWKADYKNSVYIGEIFARGKKVAIDLKAYTGDIITTPILREYNKDKNAMVNNLGDLATEIQVITGISKEELHKNWNISKNKTKHGLFIPYDIRKFRGMTDGISNN